MAGAEIVIGPYLSLIVRPMYGKTVISMIIKKEFLINCRNVIDSHRDGLCLLLWVLMIVHNLCTILIKFIKNKQ